MLQSPAAGAVWAVCVFTHTCSEWCCCSCIAFLGLLASHAADQTSPGKARLGQAGPDDQSELNRPWEGNAATPECAGAAPHLQQLPLAQRALW
jgi:hypothetical protein